MNAQKYSLFRIIRDFICLIDLYTKEEQKNEWASIDHHCTNDLVIVTGCPTLARIGVSRTDSNLDQNRVIF